MFIIRPSTKILKGLCLLNIYMAIRAYNSKNLYKTSYPNGSILSLYFHSVHTVYGPTHIWLTICDFQQCVILTSVDSYKPVQPPSKLRNSKWCSVRGLRVIEYWSRKQRLWSDCTYVQADLRLCWLQIPHCWKSHVAAHMRKSLQ